MEQKDFEGKVVLITGSSQGIGEVTAKAFAKEGAKIILTAKDRAELEKVVAEIKSVGGEAVSYPFDITNIEETTKVAREILVKFGRVNVLVNNVGIGVAKNLKQTSPEDFDLVVGTNLKGPFFLTQQIVSKMGEADSIIFITSIHAERPSLDPTYDGSKAMINNWTKNFSLELAKSGIRVNAIAPGHIDKEPGAEPRVQRDVPLTGKAGRPADIAKAVLILADNDKSRYVTGQILEVGGGLSLWDPALEERL